MQASMCSIGFQQRDKWMPAPVIERPLARVVDIVGRAGFAGVEVWQPHWGMADEGERARVREVLARHRLAVPMLSGYFNFTKSPQHAAISLARGHRIIAQAADLGAERIRLFTGNHRSADASPEQWYRATSCLRELADHGAEAGIGLALETHDWNLVDTVAGCERLLELVDRPNLGLIFQANTFPPTAWSWALERLAPHVVHVHCNPKDPAEPVPWDWFDQLERLAARGFNGFVSLEYFGPRPDFMASAWGPWLQGLCARASHG